jgi:WD40 repeat protein/uncharacterized caspase-like protein
MSHSNHTPRPIFLVLALLIISGLACNGSRGTKSPEQNLISPVSNETTAKTSTGSKGPQVWAVLIGIDQYSDDAIPSCHGAARDTSAVGDWFVKSAGWSSRNVLKINDLGPPAPGPDPDQVTNLQPSKANLDWAFKVWLRPEKVQPDDLVVVMFAGQAIALPPRPNDPLGSPGRHYLLPNDARTTQWDKSGWRLDEALDNLAARGKNPIVCWLDTSVFGRGKRADRTKDFVPSATPMLQALARWPGVAVWLAADGQPAAESSRVGDVGPFATALLAALGTPEQPHNLHECLSRLNQNPAVTRQGFRTLGGFEPALSVWSSKVQQASLANREILLQRGHAGGISALGFSADGSRMFTGALDSTLKIWNVEKRLVQRALAYHLVGVTSLSLSPDGTLLASGDGAGWLRLWNLVQQKEIPTGPPHDRGVERIAFLPEGSRFISLDMDGKCWLWGTADPINQVRQVSRRCTGMAAASRPGTLAFALAEDDGKIQLHGPDGKLVMAVDGPEGVVTSRRLAFDGKTLLVGSDQGQVIAWDVATTKEVLRKPLGRAIDTVALGPEGVLYVATGNAVHAFRPNEKEERAALAIDAPANVVAASNDGQWLAACTEPGTLHAWKLDEAGAYQPLPLEGVERSGLSTMIGFTPGSRKLVSGDQDGGLRTWDLPNGNQRLRIPSRRGQIATLSVSENTRYLLQVSQDRQAQVWDLQDGRALSSIPGEWTAGVLSPDGATAYLTTLERGDVVALDRETGHRLDVRFPRPEAQPGGTATTRPFGKLAISRDGQWLAAASAQGIPACVWETKTGKIVQTIRGHEEPSAITAIGFSADGKEVLTASEDGTAKVWDRTQPAPEQPLATFRMIDEATGDPLPISAAALSPTAPRRVVTGGLNGQLLLWEGGKEKPTDLGRLDRAILAIAFTPDGSAFAAAGADKSVWVWQTDRPRQRVRLEPNPQHTEQVNVLIGWPNNKLFASGSDDTTIKLWSLEERRLLGTLSAEQGTPDWVAYTPEGLFDSSNGSESQVTWLVNREILTFDQVYERFHIYKLNDSLRKGIRPKAKELPREPLPRITIDEPARPVEQERIVPLTISLGEPDLINVRLYQNGVPVMAVEDLTADAERGTRRVSAKVPLRHGLNRFYVMAGRAGSIDVEGRSPVVEVRFDGPDTPPQLHVIALGVSRYKKDGRSLQFADRDAQEMADFLYKKGLGNLGTPGLRIILTDDQVTEDAVTKKFEELRERVKERPEDTVVVFMAGHADTLDRRFYLLLPPFPFRDGPSAGSTMVPASVASGEAALGYTTVYRNLSRLNALQRLVMIDACQAEAIGDDPGIRQIQEVIDGGAQRARTAYLLAARRGEPANEQAALKHGLMTYALLRGMGDTSLEGVPDLTILDDLPNADRDHDGKVTTDELRWYADLSVPRLAEHFPLLVQRAGAGPFKPLANLEQKPRVQASGATFPIVEIGAAKPAEASAPGADR